MSKTDTLKNKNVPIFSFVVANNGRLVLKNSTNRFDLLKPGTILKTIKGNNYLMVMYRFPEATQVGLLNLTDKHCVGLATKVDANDFLENYCLEKVPVKKISKNDKIKFFTNLMNQK